MGLSERKIKQKISYDPRNLSWSEDKSRFSYKHMKNLGWADASGIGADLSGNPNHIAVARKSDNSGIGMGRAIKEGEESGGQARAGLEDVLRRLASASASPSPSSGPSTPPVVDAPASVPSRNKIASRQRHLQSKRMAMASPSALAEILGIAQPSTSSPLATPSIATSPPPVSEASTTTETVRIGDETVTTSTLSVSDYFRQKMRERAQARAGGVVEVPVEASVAVQPVSDWQGSRTTFELPAPEVDAPATPILDASAVKAERKAVRRAEKEAVKASRKAEKEAAKAARKAEKSKEKAAKASRPQVLGSPGEVAVVQAEGELGGKETNKKRKREPKDD